MESDKKINQQNGFTKIVVTIINKIDLVSEVTGKAVSFLLLGLIFVVVQEVVRRYVFDSPSAVSVELSKFIYSAVFLLSGAYALSQKAHISLDDVIYQKLSPRLQATLNLVTYLLFFFIFVGALLWTTADSALRSWLIKETTGSVWNPPYYPIKAIVPLSVSLLMLQGFANFIRSLVYLIKGVEI